MILVISLNNFLIQKYKIMRLTFGIVQMLDGFKTTDDNVKGKMPEYIAKGGFENVQITQSINTAIGTFSYFKAQKY